MCIDCQLNSDSAPWLGRTLLRKASGFSEEVPPHNFILPFSARLSLAEVNVKDERREARRGKPFRPPRRKRQSRLVVDEVLFLQEAVESSNKRHSGQAPAFDIPFIHRFHEGCICIGERRSMREHRLGRPGDWPAEPDEIK